MKLIHNNQYVKLIPEKFDEIENITDFIENEFEKRLSKTERENLTAALFQQRVKRLLIHRIKQKEPLVYEQIQHARPIKTFKVTTNDHQVYYVVEFDNKVKVRCSEFLHRVSPVRGRLKYAACLATTKIPPPAREQLQLFSSVL